MPTTTPQERADQHGCQAYGSDWQPTLLAQAPGRLELLGNHVDYNGGLVLAGAIDRIVAIVSADGDDSETIAMVAGDVSAEVASIPVEACRDWHATSTAIGPFDYARGVIASLLARRQEIHGGRQLSIAGNVPLGFGMSSSAGLCVALVMTLASTELTTRDIVAIAREAEHRCGSPVGAMDQSASVAGGVILFDGRDASYSVLEPELGDYVFAVADSRVTHALGTSSYPVRVAESQEALDIIRSSKVPDLASLGELGPDQWNTIRPDLADRLTDRLRQRVDHVVSEVARVRLGVEAVQAADWDAFGRLMTESGQSSNRNYEISHPKVEELVDELNAIDGVAGARMMGGGEGGPALALIHHDALPDIAATLERGFFRRNPSHLQGDRLQVCSFGPGAKIVVL
ncbi:MAG: hypothetical protein M3457_03625 [Chloroflexota bacterium]|nr:hypothetical protein [Chloroflexota bacterium]